MSSDKLPTFLEVISPVTSEDGKYKKTTSSPRKSVLASLSSSPKARPFRPAPVRRRVTRSKSASVKREKSSPVKEVATLKFRAAPVRRRNESVAKKDRVNGNPDYTFCHVSDCHNLVWNRYQPGGISKKAIDFMCTQHQKEIKMLQQPKYLESVVFKVGRIDDILRFVTDFFIQNRDLKPHFDVENPTRTAGNSHYGSSVNYFPSDDQKYSKRLNFNDAAEYFLTFYPKSRNVAYVALETDTSDRMGAITYSAIKIYTVNPSFWDDVHKV